MSKHTPGPWELSSHDKHGQRLVTSEHIEICTCWHHSVRSIEKEMESNARLIAAAPELLELVQLAAKGSSGAFVSRCEAVIAKATGAAL